MNPTENGKSTPLPVIAKISQCATRIVDRITGDRSDYPLLVAAACVEGLKAYGFSGRIFFGKAAWIEILDDHTPSWAGCWAEMPYFWVQTEFAETVDLNSAVAHRKKAHSDPSKKSLYSPPLLWSKEIPRFYRFVAEGVAEVAPESARDQKWLTQVLEEMRTECTPEALDDFSFPNEPIIGPNRMCLDDSAKSFQHFDRSLSVHPFPNPPV